MATANNGAPLSSVPDDVLQRILVGVPLDDHRAAASACRTFRDVINGSRFPALRRKYGFAEQSVVIVYETGDGVVNIRMGHQDVAMDIFSRFAPWLRGVSTTDGATRLFVCTWRLNAPDIAPDIWSVDASSRRWRHFATLPLNYSAHCMEWHDGRLYFAGGRHKHRYNDSLHAFNETTGLWEELPPMPHACANAASGVIGNELFIAAGDRENGVATSTLQIYDITTRTWRFGALVPYLCYWTKGVVVDDKLFVFGTADPRHGMLAYDPQSDTWSEEAVPFNGIVEHACAHKGRVVVFLRNSMAFERGADGAWSRFVVGASSRFVDWPAVNGCRAVSGSVLLG